jgi:hypothetical protein
MLSLLGSSSSFAFPTVDKWSFQIFQWGGSLDLRSVKFDSCNVTVSLGSNYIFVTSCPVLAKLFNDGD